MPISYTFTPGGVLWADNSMDRTAASFLHQDGQRANHTDRKSRDAPRLTSLVGGNVDRDVLWGKGALAGDSVDGLDVEGVGGVGPQAADGDSALSQTQLLWHKLHVVITAGAAPAVCPALFTDDVVGHIIPPTCLPWRVPLQNDRCLIDN